jgi:hypothetical protein
MQDRRRRAGFAHVCGGCREGPGTGRASLPGCFAFHGHFAGDDDTRARTFLDVANDESFDAEARSQMVKEPEYLYRHE